MGIVFAGRFLDTLSGFLFPPACLICRSSITDRNEKYFCIRCFAKISYTKAPFCNQCGIPFDAESGKNHLCGTCLNSTSKPYFSLARATGIYQNTLREAICQFKYQKRAILAKPLGILMGKNNFNSLNFKFYQLLIPVPLHYKRLKERGFNQALLLARQIRKIHNVPIDYLSLKRNRFTRPQVDLIFKERKNNVKGAFSLKNENNIKDKNILLLDDVFTTGATVNECAKVLIRGGAKKVDVLTLARAA